MIRSAGASSAKVHLGSFECWKSRPPTGAHAAGARDGRCLRPRRRGCQVPGYRWKSELRFSGDPEPKQQHLNWNYSTSCLKKRRKTKEEIMASKERDDPLGEAKHNPSVCWHLFQKRNKSIQRAIHSRKLLEPVNLWHLCADARRDVLPLQTSKSYIEPSTCAVVGSWQGRHRPETFLIVQNMPIVDRSVVW